MTKFLNSKDKRLQRIFKDIKAIKIQGATNIAKAAIQAYSISPNKKTLSILRSLRPTEPTLFHVTSLLAKGVEPSLLLSHFKESQTKINFLMSSIIKNGDRVFIHCHSQTIIDSLIYCKNNSIRFCVYSTETRPLFQGHKSWTELSNSGIKVIGIIDSAARVILSGSQKMNKPSKIFLGADAIFPDGSVVNKIGSAMFAELAYHHKVPVYIVSDSWKFSKKLLTLEKRDPKEILNIKSKNIKIENFAFEVIPKEYIHSIVSEVGIMSPLEFVKFMKANT